MPDEIPTPNQPMTPASFDPNPAEQTPPADPIQPQISPPLRASNKTTLMIAFVTFILLVLGGAGYYYFQMTKSEPEPQTIPVEQTTSPTPTETVPETVEEQELQELELDNTDLDQEFQEIESEVQQL